MSEVKSEYQTLREREWTDEGARFLIEHKDSMPAMMLRKLFGEKNERSQPKTECSRCGYRGVALDRHHVYGKKNSVKTIVLCANCHREVHAEEDGGK